MNTLLKNRSIAITSSKGGTGKSVLSVSLAYAISHLGYKTLLMDLDVFTGGTTFYALADYSVKIENGLQDLLLMDSESDLNSKFISPIKIPNAFCQNNLYLLPSIANFQRNRPEILLSKLYNPSKVNRVLKYLIDKYTREGFDYIIIDTRGGSDFISICSSLAADGFIYLTEADKTSWDTGKLLFNTIAQLNDKENNNKCLGFILNKNVLPSESIETFLKKEWGLPHLATIPLDVDTVKYFQQDKIPFVEDLANSISVGVFSIIEKVILPDNYDESLLEGYRELKLKSLISQKEKALIRVKIKNMSRILQITQSIVSLLIVSIITALFYKRSASSDVKFMFLLVIGVLIFINILSLFFKARLDKVNKYFVNNIN